MPRKINVYYLGKVYFVFRCKVVYKYLILFHKIKHSRNFSNTTNTPKHREKIYRIDFLQKRFSGFITRQQKSVEFLHIPNTNIPHRLNLGTSIPLYNEIQSNLFPGNTRISPVAYSIFLGIKDVSKTNQRRYKDVHKRP